MTRLFLIFVFNFICKMNLLAQPVANSLLPRVDKRIELLSVVYKLANKNYLDNNPNPIYSKAIKLHFSKYANHSIIKYVQHLIDSLQKDSIDIGSWEIPSVALHLSQPPKLESLVLLNDKAMSDAWDDRTLLNIQFLTLLKQFYNDAKCEAFFKSQEPYYLLVNKQYEKHGIKLNKKWIDIFFSLSTTENYYGILNLQGLGNGDYIRVNFKNNHRNTHTIIGCSAFDKNGLPTDFSNPMIARSNLHEYIHAFTNQLIDKNYTVLQKYADTILSNPSVYGLMKNTFYGNPKYLLYESLVRAISIKYLIENGGIKTTKEKEIAAQEKNGFFWIRQLVDLLDRYYENRKLYKDFETFMPELIEFFRKQAEEKTNIPMR